jgi:prepilin-type N-terminal cleavage/methylation domain-containing protein
VSGFTLLELIIALGIVAVLLVITFGGLRVGLAAWQQGEERAASLDRARSLVLLLERTVAGTFPYRGTLAEAERTRIIFDGRPNRLTFVTATAFFPSELPIAFTAVSLSAGGGLTLRQPRNQALSIAAPSWWTRRQPRCASHLGQEPEAWQEQWNTSEARELPRAVEITLLAGAGGRRVAQAFTVPIRASVR